jgi:hypothetical protein
VGGSVVCYRIYRPQLLVVNMVWVETSRELDRVARRKRRRERRGEEEATRERVRKELGKRPKKVIVDKGEETLAGNKKCQLSN